jgi:tripartite-type tricarboxylate transporter receptor subunit TctC
MKLKRLAVLLTAVMVSSFAYGCSGAKSGTNTAANTETKKAVNFPTDTIQIIVPYAAGGGTDSVARKIAEEAKGSFSKPVIVVNKAGGGGAVGMAEGSKAKPDGHTVTMITVELTTLNHLGLAPFTYSEFKPVVRINADPAALTVRADAPWNSVEEFLKYAKENPGKIKIGNSGIGAIWHLAAAAIEEKTGVKFNHIPMEGAAPAVTALMGGHIDAVTVSPAEVASQVAAGKLKVLGVLADQRVPGMPNVKTFKEQGVDVSIATWRGFGVPKDTPDEVVKILQDGFMKAAESQSFKDYMAKMNLGLAVQDSKAFAESIKKDNDNFKTLIEKLGLKK